MLVMIGGCTGAPAMGDAAPTAPASHPSAAAPASASAAVEPASTAIGAPDAGPPPAATGTPDAGARAPAVKDNMVRPALDGDELQERARALFDAIVKDDPPAGDPFWFPKEPFVPLKDVKGPDKYWDNLHAAYANDIHALHRKRTSWDGARFVRFAVGSTPKWVKPGDEANKIGYFRSFHGKLGYEVAGAAATIDVHTIISWQGSWYVTHLRKLKK
jgi:hypothetical protein